VPGTGDACGQRPPPSCRSTSDCREAAAGPSTADVALAMLNGRTIEPLRSHLGAGCRARRGTHDGSHFTVGQWSKGLCRHTSSVAPVLSAVREQNGHPPSPASGSEVRRMTAACGTADRCSGSGHCRGDLPRVPYQRGRRSREVPPLKPPDRDARDPARGRLSSADEL
jgi:hypothetical protein